MGGIGIAGTAFAVGIGHVSRWYPPQEQGLVLGITAIGNVGTAVAGFTVPALYLSGGMWRVSVVVAGLLLLAAAAIWWGTRDAVQVADTASQRNASSPTSLGTSGIAAHQSAARLWTRPVLWQLALFYFVTFGGFMAFGNYLPTLLQAQFHLTPVDAGLRASGFVLLATAMRPVGGWLADRLSPRGLLVGVFAFMAALAALFAVGLDRILWTTVAALGISVLVGLGNGIVFKLVPTEFPDATGKATGLVGAVGGVGGFFPPLAMGFLKEQTSSYSAGLWLLCATCLLVFSIAWISARRGVPVPPMQQGRRVA
ncbi:MAG: MFS transporter [Thermoflavifilum sp.]|nr:MFS transporter [Thermoflavifilum sp.]MCL6513486.1 MFS transporter [Alicyclobacillus sp.]